LKLNKEFGLEWEWLSSCSIEVLFMHMMIWMGLRWRRQSY